ncbi:MAG: hypothetical protein KDB99_08415 [Chitinophagaceae bacterium]|nr:hypothetical protein [Chitinophagaceae bacterium]
MNLKKILYKFLYKPGTKKIYWEKVISSSAVVVAFIVIVIVSQKNVNEKKAKLEKYSKYTIGITIRSYKNIKGGRHIKFEYEVNDEKFKNSTTWPWVNNTVITNGGRYIVQYDSTNPSNSKAFFNCPVPDYIDDAPANGWSKAPTECSK